LADGLDPSVTKREEKHVKATAAANTFEVVARDWLVKTANKRAAATRDKITNWLEKDVLPYIGKFPIAKIKAKDVLDKVARRIPHLLDAPSMAPRSDARSCLSQTPSRGR
jgi:hypothetical protein